MRFFTVVKLLLGAQAVTAAQSWAGSNLYYASGLSDSQQDDLFSQLQSADIQVLRVWLDGVSGTEKGTQVQNVPFLQHGDAAGQYDDTILSHYDSLMVKAANYSIKLMVSLHSFNSLEGQWDYFGKKYGTEDFYTDATARQEYQQRIGHVLSHVNPHTGKTWAQSSEYIFAFETQNEASNNDEQFLKANMPEWQCTMASTIKSGLGGNTDILVTTGGGGWLEVSMLDAYFACASLDVLAIHAYGIQDLTVERFTPWVAKATAANKKLVLQEWGACYFDTNNNLCPQGGVLAEATRAQNLKAWAGAASQAGIPWMYWQILPQADPHGGVDFEIGIGDGAIWDTLKGLAQAAKGYASPFDFAQWLPGGVGSSGGGGGGAGGGGGKPQPAPAPVTPPPALASTTFATSVAPPKPTVADDCDWPGHCLGAACTADQYCADDLTCNSGRCGQPSDD